MVEAQLEPLDTARLGKADLRAHDGRRIGLRRQLAALVAGAARGRGVGTEDAHGAERTGLLGSQQAALGVEPQRALAGIAGDLLLDLQGRNVPAFASDRLGAQDLTRHRGDHPQLGREGLGLERVAGLRQAGNGRAANALGPQQLAGKLCRPLEALAAGPAADPHHAVAHLRGHRRGLGRHLQVEPRGLQPALRGLNRGRVGAHFDPRPQAIEGQIHPAFHALAGGCFRDRFLHRAHGLAADRDDVPLLGRRGSRYRQSRSEDKEDHRQASPDHVLQALIAHWIDLRSGPQVPGPGGVFGEDSLGGRGILTGCLLLSPNRSR